MHQEFLMGNEAIAMGAIAAGVGLVCGYPGTPSTEVLETVASHRPEGTYVEWSVNEKTAMEIAAGAAYAGTRALVTMKQMGLNVAADPLMCLSYIGVKGGLVVLVADDPGPISSQTEQDSRTFAAFAKVPVFDPSSPFEAYEMIQEAFAFSEEYGTPVFLRSTTRVSHGYESISVKDPEEYPFPKEGFLLKKGFIKDSSRWVIFPRLSNANHRKIEARNQRLQDILSNYPGNRILEEELPAKASAEELSDSPFAVRGIAAGGFSFTYALETRARIRREAGEAFRLFKVSTPFPFPEKKAIEFLQGLDEVLCIEELDPVIERALTYVCGKYGLKTRILGKLTGDMPSAGENSREIVQQAIEGFLHIPYSSEEKPDLPPLPVRPPVLCAGCPHRASFYAVKKAMQGKKTIYCGDIGCYTLGNAMPLDMVDTCLCMGAGLGIAQAISHVEPDTACFAFVGDSTFFASAIPSVVNAVYNQADMTLIVLDNSTTAMTGHQPHPGTGRTMMGEIVSKVSIEAILRGIGLSFVETIDPFDHTLAVDTVQRAAKEPGVKAIIFRSPCIALPAVRKNASLPLIIDPEKCIGCQRCIREIGCPALLLKDGKAAIDPAQCTGCGLCQNLCRFGAISQGGAHV
ncbi:MAG: indolepyruvate ferredoxin oxidoreductase subunit alpha [Firmicutes bacterium]|nr:indolepyruvate ferredoxin oxidoreductase subunit alpha [Bacillota bacterium]